MIKLFIALVLFNSICCCTYAQNTTADSLTSLLATTKEDTTRAILMAKISRAYLFSKPDTALSIARKGMELSRKINFKKGQAVCLRSIGAVFSQTGNYPA